MSVTVKANDHLRKLSDTLLLNGAALDLTGAAVVCVLRHTETGTVFRRTATIRTPATAGQVEYDLTSTDLTGTNPFTYLHEWEVTLPSTKKITFPASGYNTIEIQKNLSS